MARPSGQVRRERLLRSLAMGALEFALLLIAFITFALYMIVLAPTP